MADDFPDTPFHPGEHRAQMRFNADWNDNKASRLGRIIGGTLDDEKALFIESLPFFFLATADADGNCDCSYRGTETGPDDRPLPVVQVVEPKQLLFPDYAGNRMFNSLGNILVNPHLGLLFIDFSSQTRLRVNGRAEIVEKGAWQGIWPNATRAVTVNIEQVYWNCSRRIPRHP